MVVFIEVVIGSDELLISVVSDEMQIFLIKPIDPSWESELLTITEYEFVDTRNGWYEIGFGMNCIYWSIPSIVICFEYGVNVILIVW